MSVKIHQLPVDFSYPGYFIGNLFSHATSPFRLIRRLLKKISQVVFLIFEILRNRLCNNAKPCFPVNYL